MRVSTKEIREELELSVKVAKEFLEIWDNSLDSVRKTAQKLKDIRVEIDPKSVKDFEKIVKIEEETKKAVEETNEIIKAKTKLQKEIARSEAKIIELQTAENKQLAENKKRIQESNAELKKKINIEKELGFAYDDQEDLLKKLLTTELKQVKTIQDANKQNKALRDIVNSLNPAIKEEAEQIKRLNGVINSNNQFIKENSDEQSKNRQNVGNYTESIKEAIGENAQFGQTFTTINNVFQNFQGAMKQNVADIRTYSQGLLSATGSAGKFTQGLKLIGTVSKGLGIGLIITAIAGAVSYFKEFSGGAESLRVFTAQAKAVADVIINRLGNAFGGLAGVFSGLFGSLKAVGQYMKGDFVTAQKTLEESQKSLSEGTEKLKNGFSGWGDAISTATEKAKALELQLIDLEKANIGTIKQINKLRRAEEDLQRDTDDTTSGLQTREENARKLLATRQEIANKEVMLAQQDLENEKKRLELVTELSRAEINDLIKNNETKDRFGIEELKRIAELEEAEKNAIDRRDDLIVESQIAERERNLKFMLNQIDLIKDTAKLEEDVLIGQINKEETTYAERLKLLDDFNKNSVQSIENQIDVIKKGAITISEIDALALENNANIINEKITTLDLTDKEADAFRNLLLIRNEDLKQATELQNKVNEIETKRLADIERRNKEARERTANANREEIATEQEKYADLQTDYDLFLQENKELRDLFIADLEADKDLELSNDKLTTEEKIEIEEKYRRQLEDLNYKFDEKEKKRKDQIAEEEKKRQEDEARAREQLRQDLKDIGEKATEDTINQLVKLSEAKQEALQKDIEIAKQRQSELVNIAETEEGLKGKLASEGLAKQREIERQKTQELEKEKKRQQRLEFILAGIKAYSANAGQPNALPKTVAEISTLLATLASTGSFFVGTDRVGKTDKPLDSKGGMLATIHPDEMIIQKELNAKMGYPTRDEVANVFTAFREGRLVEPIRQKQGQMTVIQANNNKELLNGIAELVGKTANYPAQFDVVKGAIEYKERRGNRVNKFIKKV